MSKQALFKQFDVWKKNDSKTVLRYRILQEVNSLKYYINTVDVFEAPLKVADLQKLEREYWFIERLLYDDPPNERAAGFDSIDDAVRAFDEGD